MQKNSKIAVFLVLVGFAAVLILVHKKINHMRVASSSDSIENIASTYVKPSLNNFRRKHPNPGEESEALDDDAIIYTDSLWKFYAAEQNIPQEIIKNPSLVHLPDRAQYRDILSAAIEHASSDVQHDIVQFYVNLHNPTHPVDWDKLPQVIETGEIKAKVAIVSGSSYVDYAIDFTGDNEIFVVGGQNEGCERRGLGRPRHAGSYCNDKTQAPGARLHNVATTILTHELVYKNTEVTDNLAEPTDPMSRDVLIEALDGWNGDKIDFVNRLESQGYIMPNRLATVKSDDKWAIPEVDRVALEKMCDNLREWAKTADGRHKIPLLVQVFKGGDMDGQTCIVANSMAHGGTGEPWYIYLDADSQQICDELNDAWMEIQGANIGEYIARRALEHPDERQPAHLSIPGAGVYNAKPSAIRNYARAWYEQAKFAPVDVVQEVYSGFSDKPENYVAVFEGLVSGGANPNEIAMFSADSFSNAILASAGFSTLPAEALNEKQTKLREIAANWAKNPQNVPDPIDVWEDIEHSIN
jgi:hypothetical protein